MSESISYQRILYLTNKYIKDNFEPHNYRAFYSRNMTPEKIARDLFERQKIPFNCPDKKWNMSHTSQHRWKRRIGIKFCEPIKQTIILKNRAERTEINAIKTLKSYYKFVLKPLKMSKCFNKKYKHFTGVVL